MNNKAHSDNLQERFHCKDDSECVLDKLNNLIFHCHVVLVRIVIECQAQRRDENYKEHKSIEPSKKW